MVASACPLATIHCEPRQARKGAAAAVNSGAGVWLAEAATRFGAVLVDTVRKCLSNLARSDHGRWGGLL
jgi:hypothetical protein